MFHKVGWLLSLMLSCTLSFAQDREPEKERQDQELELKFEPGEQVANSISVSDEEGNRRDIEFWLYTPSNYEELDSLPWMMFLHGMGERGQDLELVKKWGPPKRLADRDDFPFILISPQCPEDIVWKTSHLVQILDAVQAQMKVDEKRLYMTGLSMGGYGTWAMLAEIPERIAAAVPICGGGRSERAERIIAVPVWAFHGDADGVVPIRESQKMVDAINEAGGNAKLKAYEGVGHNSWSQTYANEEVYQWLLEHTTDR